MSGHWSWPGGAAPAGGGSPAPLAQLTPTEFTPYGQWALDMQGTNPFVTPFPDRSGNGRSMTSSIADRINIVVPDTRTSKTAPSRVLVSPRLNTIQYGAPFAGVSIFDNAEVSFAIRATYNPNSSGLGTTQVIMGADGYVLLGATNATPSRLTHTPYTLGAIATATLSLVPWEEVYYSVRRFASGAIRFGVNDAFETVAAVQPPTVYTRISVGASLSFGALTPWLGSASDYNAWPSFLSDAVISGYARRALGT